MEWGPGGRLEMPDHYDEPVSYLGHGVYYYACGQHVMVQCRCMDHGGRKVITNTECPECSKERGRFR